MKISSLVICMLSGMLRAPEWNMPTRFEEGTIGNYLASFYANAYNRVTSLCPSRARDHINDFVSTAGKIMVKIDPSLENDPKKILWAINKLYNSECLLLTSYIDNKSCTEDVLRILTSLPHEMLAKVNEMKDLIDESPDLVRCLRSIIHTDLSRYGMSELVNHLMKDGVHYPGLNVDPKYLDSIYQQLCTQQYKYTLNILLALQREQLAQLADGAERLDKDIKFILRRQDWNMRLNTQLMPLAELTLNWYKILYELAPKPWISKISTYFALSGNLYQQFDDISSDMGFELFKALYAMGFVDFDGSNIKLIGGEIPYLKKQTLLNSCPINGFSKLLHSDLVINSVEFGLSQNAEIKVLIIPTAILAQIINDPHYIRIVMHAGLPGPLFDIEVIDSKGLLSNQRMTTKDLIEHNLMVNKIHLSNIQFASLNVFDLGLTGQNIPLDSDLLKVYEALSNLMTNSNYGNFESFRKQLKTIPWTDEAMREINDLPNPFLTDTN